MGQEKAQVSSAHPRAKEVSSAAAEISPLIIQQPEPAARSRQALTGPALPLLSESLRDEN